MDGTIETNEENLFVNQMNDDSTMSWAIEIEVDDNDGTSINSDDGSNTILSGPFEESESSNHCDLGESESCNHISSISTQAAPESPTSEVGSSESISPEINI